MRPFLDGVTEVTLSDPGTDTVLFSRTVQFGERPDRIEVVNPAGRPLALDKSLKLVETFDTRDAAQVEPLLDAIEEVLGALRRVGLDAFLAYGTALGAIRDGGLIGHDSDADLGYVSTYDHPVDVIRESFRIQRALTDMGYRVTRYSAIALKVHVLESDGLDRGLDVFGGFMRAGSLYLMGEIAVPFERDWIFPLGTASLEGREFPVPADADKFLTATYGPRWRVPDPAYKFTTPASTIELFNGWFRGMRTGRAGWHGYHKRTAHHSRVGLGRRRGRSPSATPTSRRTSTSAADAAPTSAWFADRGVRAIGLDFQPYAYAAEEQRRADDPRVTFQLFNLLELRHVLAVPGLDRPDAGPARRRLRARRRAARSPRPAQHAARGPHGAGRDHRHPAPAVPQREGARRLRSPHRRPQVPRPRDRRAPRWRSPAAGCWSRSASTSRTTPGSSQVCRMIIDWNA